MYCVHRSGVKNDDPYTKPLSKKPATMPAVIATVFFELAGWQDRFLQWSGVSYQSENSGVPTPRKPAQMQESSDPV
jgi:hypothetical protein